MERPPFASFRRGKEAWSGGGGKSGWFIWGRGRGRSNGVGRGLIGDSRSWSFPGFGSIAFRTESEDVVHLEDNGAALVFR